MKAYSTDISNAVRSNREKTDRNRLMLKTIGTGIIYLRRKGILTWLALFFLWSFAAQFWDENFFPSVLKTISGSKEIISDGTLLSYVGVSLLRVYSGWLIGGFLGVLAGLLVGRIRAVRELMEPFLNFFRFVPAIAFLTLFIMWFGVGEESKIILIAYAVFFVVVINTVDGVLNIDKIKIQAARSMGISERKIFFHVIIPAVVPYIFTALRLGMGAAFTSIVAAEMMSAKEGIGYLIFTSRLYFRMDWIFTGLVALGLMGFFSDRLLRMFGMKLFGKYGIREGRSFGK